MRTNHASSDQQRPAACLGAFHPLEPRSSSGAVALSPGGRWGPGLGLSPGTRGQGLLPGSRGSTWGHLLLSHQGHPPPKSLPEPDAHGSAGPRRPLPLHGDRASLALLPCPPSLHGHCHRGLGLVRAGQACVGSTPLDSCSDPEQAVDRAGTLGPQVPLRGLTVMEKQGLGKADLSRLHLSHQVPAQPWGAPGPNAAGRVPRRPISWQERPSLPAH